MSFDLNHDVPALPGRPASHYPPFGPHAAFASDLHPVAMPKVGQTRCCESQRSSVDRLTDRSLSSDWALLSSELQFIYLDPVLQLHLDQQAELLVGKSLLSFVHPDEQASAKIDLGGVLESRTLHGSVTRVRFSRLSRVRRQLGYDGPPPPWLDADKVALDNNYMAVDIVINWAAQGLVLCFIHAIVDLNPSDNDERRKTGWTNWCGTPHMDDAQIQLLYRRLLVCVQRPTTMNRVFQILNNSPGRTLLLSWPPDQGQGTQHPNAADFAHLVENAQIGNGLQDGNDAKTSCTRRYKAMQSTPSLGPADVESIFIPHGSVIFACHKVDSPSRSPAAPASSSATMQQLGYHSYSPSSAYYDSAGPAAYALPPLPASSYPSYPPQASAYAPQRWAAESSTTSSSSPYPPQHQQQQAWGSPSPAHSVSSLPPAVSNLRSGSYPPPPPQQGHHWQPPPPPGSPSAFDTFPRTASPGGYPSPTPNTNNNNNNNTNGGAYNTDEDNAVPPARRRLSPASARNGAGGEGYVPGGRSAANRPSGVLKCSSCKATSSPEWRKGPSGKKELCNA
ncbi:hypothetical protein H0H81_008954 [Sphagnurus paluster]|uniref:GATA-type domain-containing protein n=1 Tax=Sphagnurus paluster TaxID=117069 RepID=A0A9P7K7H8_9AGAR|nr:hypothetical protein H0H81_008954 [Sphagnurus paluster]